MHKDPHGSIIYNKTGTFGEMPVPQWISSEILVKRLWQLICLQQIYHYIDWKDKHVQISIDKL